MGGSRRLRLAYVTTYDARDVRQWSGCGHFIAAALAGAGADLEYTGPLRERRSFLLRGRQLVQGWIPNHHYLRDRDPIVLEGYARQVERALRGWTGDFVFSPGTIPVASARLPAPLAFWTDGTFGGMLGYYPHLRGLSRASVRAGMAMENAALERCAVAIYSSRWAADSAVRLHGADPAKVKVVPFGANLPLGDPADPMARAGTRPRDRCELVFVGVEWERKGGPTAVAAARQLNAQGVPTRLTVIGCRPRIGERDAPYVKVIGRLDKRSESGSRLLAELLAGSHFSILPTQADCSPLVLAEAAAFALPAISVDTGGVSEMVIDGQTGYLLPPEADGDAFAAVIARAFADHDEYLRLCEAALAHYRNELNWATGGRRALAHLRQALAKLDRLS